ncbi:PIN domain-containing protein [Thiothrix litoralis]|jgi:tRNA(fMet)-specific endonuclease VapC|uniref:PIN domain-containing protein n=1 Tax=Thiothrix litoralis TaxID=2891210 RepID=A0ABX7WNI4_9GAMM|nr:PIN domain-containing protein [Thiothrix litoralis]QTR44676.1 PIN domain-containing protein [Thiothrix litoralis]
MTNYRYLLDTNIISNLFREPQGNVYQHLQRVGENTVCTSIVVAAELRFGAKNVIPRF